MSSIPLYHTIKVSVDKHVALITMSRPDAHNTWTPQMQAELTQAYEELEKVPSVRAIVITGDPAGKCFCAGADLTTASFVTLDPTSLSEILYRDRGGKVAVPIARSRKITIAAINGNAAGIGITMTLPMDLRFVWKGAKIAFPFVRRGLVPEATSSYHLPLLLGRSRALAILLQGTPFPASSPLLDGLFANLLDNKEDVLPYALKIAHDLSENTSPISVAFTKSLVLNMKFTPEEQHLLDSRALYVTGNADSKEGIQSFMEKRAPQFKDYDTLALPDWLKAKM